MALMDLFRPGWKDRDWEKRVAAVEELKNHAVLSRIARRDSVSYVREAAVRRLTELRLFKSGLTSGDRRDESKVPLLSGRPREKGDSQGD